MKIVVLVLALALLGCGQAKSDRCDLSAGAQASFTEIETRDTISAASSGDDCAHATLAFSVRKASGEEIYTWSGPADLGADDPNADNMQKFLDSVIAGAPVTYTTLAPFWDQLSVDSRAPLNRASYEARRTQQMRMICHWRGRNQSRCVYWDPGAAEVRAFFDEPRRDAE